MKTEVEIRAFISRGDYLRLHKFFKKMGKKIFQDSQETIYFSGKDDLRVQKNSHYSKIWLKSGKIHQSIRKETEIIVEKNEFSEIIELFLRLGYKITCKWLRKRAGYSWRGIKAWLDYSKGYGYIIELEKITNQNHKSKQILQNLKDRLKDLNIKETSKKEFDKKYQYYVKNWKRLIKKG